MTITDIINSSDKPEEVIALLKEKHLSVPSWGELQKSYIPEQHPIIADQTLRPKDKEKGGFKEVVARISYSAEKIAVRRMNQMMFTIPVKRKYHFDKNNAELEKIADAIESVYKSVRINGVNTNRGRAYFAACEVATMWYAIQRDEEHNDYGFPTKFKLRCRSYSPMDTKYSRISCAEIYPLFDSDDDLIALSFEYTRKENGKEVVYFDTYTSTAKYTWVTIEGKTELMNVPANVAIGKIPGVYFYSPASIYEGIANNRSQIEFELSRQSDIVRKNSAPITVLQGTLMNVDDKPSHDIAREVYHVESGGGVSTVSPSIGYESAQFLINEMRKNIEEETQMPNLSMENVKGLGIASGEARKTLLTDAHMKVGEEKHEIIWGFDRECEIIKSFLGIMNVSWAPLLSQVEVEHVITPFVQNDEKQKSDKIALEVGAKIKSQRQGIAELGDVRDVDAEMAQIQLEQKTLAQNSAIIDVFPTAE